MACNCDALKAEVLSQRELMTEWFQTLMIEIRDAKVELVELINANTFNVIEQRKTTDQPLTSQQSSISKPISASAFLESINSPLQYGYAVSDSLPVSLSLEPIRNPETEQTPDPVLRKKDVSAEIEPTAEKIPFEFSLTQKQHTDGDEPLDGQVKATMALNQFSSVGSEYFSAIVKTEQIETVSANREEQFLRKDSQNSVCQQPQINRTLYRCSVCPYETFSFSNFNKHSLTHSGTKPFACDQCTYTAKSRVEIKLHYRRRHLGEKPFACDHCAYTAYNRSDLNRHLSVHTGEKPFACDQCDFRTSRKITLQNHQRIHTGEKPFQCDLCVFRAVSRSTITHHKRRSHQPQT